MISWNDIHPNNVSSLYFVPFDITMVIPITSYHTNRNCIFNTVWHSDIYTYIDTYTYIRTHTYAHIHPHTYRHTCMHACIHMYIHTDKYTHIHIITDVLCMLGISHGHDLNSLYRGNRVSWSFAHGVSCFFLRMTCKRRKDGELQFRSYKIHGEKFILEVLMMQMDIFGSQTRAWKPRWFENTNPRNLQTIRPGSPLDQWYQWFRHGFLAEEPGLSTIFWHHKSWWFALQIPFTTYITVRENLHVWRTTLPLLCQSFQSIGSNMYNS